MVSSSIVALDLDGVLVDGLQEYWTVSRDVALAFGAQPGELDAPEVQDRFRRIRPWVHTGWEMVVVAWALARGATEASFQRDYRGALDLWQARLDRSAPILQDALEQRRRALIFHDRQAWLALHRFYPGIPERLRAYANERVDWVVITTKGRPFAAELLARQDLRPLALYGREDGTKVEVLTRLLEHQRPLRFVEDRLPSLEQVTAHPQLDGIRCYLAAWGYVRRDDDQRLRFPVRWLTLETFCSPLHTWPC